MEVYTPASQEEIDDLQSTFGTSLPQPKAVIKKENLNQAWLQSQATTNQRAIEKHNQGKVFGISANILSDDTDAKQDVVDQFNTRIGISPMWDQVAEKYPGVASVISDPNNLSALKGNLDKLSFKEHLFASWNLAKQTNDLQNQIDRLALEINAGYSNPASESRIPLLTGGTGLSARTERLKNLIYEQTQLQPEKYDFVFESSRMGHFLTGLAKSAATGWANQMAVLGPALASGGAVIGSAVPAAGTAAGAAIGAGISAAASFATGAGYSIYRFMADQSKVQIIQKMVMEGAPINQQSMNVANVTGEVLGIAQQIGGGVVAGMGLKTVNSILGSKMVPKFADVLAKSPVTQSIAEQILKHPARYAEKPLYQAIGNAVSDVIKANAIMTGENYAQNFAVNFATNKAFHDAGMTDRVKSISQIASESTIGLGSAMITALPLTVLMAGLGSYGRYRSDIHNAKVSDDLFRKIDANQKKIDVSENVPDLIRSIDNSIGEEHDISHIGIDIDDAKKQLVSRGLEPEQVFNQLGLGVLYQDAIESGAEFIEVPREVMQNIHTSKIVENDTFTDVVQGAYRINDDSMTLNQSKSVEEFERQIDSEIEKYQQDKPDDYEYLRSMVTTAVHEAFLGSDKTLAQVKQEADANGEIITRMIIREAQESGRDIQDVINSIYPEIFGPRSLRMMSEDKVRASAERDARDAVKFDPGYKFNQYRLKAGKPIYVEKAIWNAFLPVAEKYSKNSFTTNPKKGIPWEHAFSEMFDTTDQNEILSILDRARYKTRSDIDTFIQERINDIMMSFRSVPKQKKGALGAVNVKSLPKIVALFKGFDSSTLIHEMGHVFITDKLEFYRSDQASEKYKTDFQPIIDFLEIDEKQTELTTKQQETFARSFESYLKNGVAPSGLLRKAFGQFRSWLVNVYRTIKTAALQNQIIEQFMPTSKDRQKFIDNGWIIDDQMGISMPPEVVGFFDRMLATEDEINATRKALHDNRSIQTKLENLGIRKDITQKMLRLHEEGQSAAFIELWDQQKPELEKNYYRKREKMIAEQNDEMRPGSVANTMWKNSEYYYVALWADRSGKTRIDSYDEIQETVQAIIRGETPASALIGADQILSVNSLEEAAFILGGLKPPRQYLNEQIEMYVQKNLPAIMNSDDFHFLGIDAYHNDKIEQSRMIELKAMEKMKNDMPIDQIKKEVGKIDYTNTRASLQVMRSAAERSLSKFTVPQIRKATRTLITEERRYAILAERYFEKDIEKATEYQRLRIYTGLKLRAAMRIYRKSEKNNLRIRQAQLFNLKQMKAQIHLDALVDLLKRFNLGQKNERRFEKMSLEEWREEFQGEVKEWPRTAPGARPSFEQWIMSNTDPNLGQVNIADWIIKLEKPMMLDMLTAEELQDVADAISNIKAYASREAGFNMAEKTAKHREDKETIIGWALANGNELEAQPQGAQLMREKDRFAYKARGIKDSFKKMTINIENLILAFSKNKNVVDNKLHQYLFQPMRDAMTGFTLDYNKYSEAFTENMKSIPLYKWQETLTGDQIELGVNLTMFDVFGWAHHLGTETNFDRLVAGLQLRSSKWTREAVERVINENIDESTWGVIENNWKIINSLWPRIADTYKKLYGFPPEKVQGRIFLTPYGEIEGGFMPLMVAEGQTRKTFESQLESISLIDQAALTSYTYNGFSKERSVTGVQYPVETNIQLLQAHIGTVLRDLHYREHLIDAHFLLKDADFQALWKTKHGQAGMDALNEWIQYISSDGQKPGEIGGDILDPFIHAATTGVMAWNLGMAFTDMVSMPLVTFNKLGFARAAKTFTHFPSVIKGLSKRTWADTPESFKKLFVSDLTDYSEVVGNAQQNQFKDANSWNDIISFVEGKSDWMKLRFKTKYADLYDYVFNKKTMSEFTKTMLFGVFHWSQAMQEIPVWKESYDRAIADGRADLEAIRIADSNIALLFGSGRLEDRPNILQQKRGLVRALNMFTTWIYSQSGNVYQASDSFMRGTPQEKAMAIAYMVSLMMVMPVVSSMATGARPKDDENMMKFAARESFGFSLRMVPMVNYFARPIAAMISRSYDPFAKPHFTNAFGVLEQGLTAMNKTLSEDVKTQEKIEAWTKVLPYIPTVPWATQMNTLIWNTWDAMTGKMDWDWSKDPFKRRAKDERK
jgi:hypothetical protein